MTAQARDDAACADAGVAAALFAVDPIGLGGVALRARFGPARDAWAALLLSLLPATVRLHRLPLHAAEDRLLGGLDIAATLRSSRPVAESGLLAHADGGLVVIPSAERLDPCATAHIAAALDRRQVAVERDGLSLRLPARFGVLAFDEGIGDDERLPEVLRERLGLHLALDSLAAALPAATRASVAEARARLSAVVVTDTVVEALCATAMVLGVTSVRAPLFALRAARAAAALAGREVVAAEDAALAAQFVLAPRATMLPAAPEGTEQESEATAPEGDAPHGDSAAGGEAGSSDQPLGETVADAARAAIPPDLLAQLEQGTLRAAGIRTSGRSGAAQASRRRGRPAGARQGDAGSGARLAIVETLRAAVPWQRLRFAEHGAASPGDQARPRIDVRREDFHVVRRKQKTETTTIFVVDASGSTALHRMAEAKGAVELLLGHCYIRRDKVALIAFRGRSADLLLPPTRSLVRAKRSLAELPGGGGTPLALGIDAAAALSHAVRRHGAAPLSVFLTDGQANVARDGGGGRGRAEEEALAAARALRAEAFDAILIDTAPRPQAMAHRLAAEMGARYLPLPRADAAGVMRAVVAMRVSP